MVVLDLDVLPADVNRRVPSLFTFQEPSAVNSKDKEQISRKLKNNDLLPGKRPGKLRRIVSSGQEGFGEKHYEEGEEIDDDGEVFGNGELVTVAVKPISHKTSDSMLCCGRRKVRYVSAIFNFHLK